MLESDRLQVEAELLVLNESCLPLFLEYAAKKKELEDSYERILAPHKARLERAEERCGAALKAYNETPETEEILAVREKCAQLSASRRHLASIDSSRIFLDELCDLLDGARFGPRACSLEVIEQVGLDTIGQLRGSLSTMSSLREVDPVQIAYRAMMQRLSERDQEQSYTEQEREARQELEKIRNATFAPLSKKLENARTARSTARNRLEAIQKPASQELAQQLEHLRDELVAKIEAQVASFNGRLAVAFPCIDGLATTGS